MKTYIHLLMRTRLTTRLIILVSFGVIIHLNFYLISEIRNFYNGNASDDSPQVAHKNLPPLTITSRLSSPTRILTPIDVETKADPPVSVVNQTESHMKTAEIPDVEEQTKGLTRSEIRDIILSANSMQKIRNEHFILDLLDEELSEENMATQKSNSSDPSARNERKKLFYKTPKFFVILIQVHSRLNYLESLIESLQHMKYIEQTLVIFSHDLYIPAMNKLIEKIDFCATLQIFYPFSLQIYPNEFPGEDPNDCPKSIKKSEALIRQCNNAAHPDKFGHYRESQIVQIKHHWFWKLAFVFEHLNVTKKLKNLNVLLLEEDYYLMPDSIHILRKLTEKILSDIDVISLGIFDRSKQVLTFKNLFKYSKSIWHSNSHNTGILFARPQWLMLKDCLNAFCTYDDYNWDWTLQHLSHNCFKLPLVSIFPVASRVIHNGECGLHHKSKTCDPSDKVKALKTAYEEKKEDFFPAELILNNVSSGIRKSKNSNGGWSDPRDHQLCMSFVRPDASAADQNENLNNTVVLVR